MLVSPSQDERSSVVESRRSIAGLISGDRQLAEFPSFDRCFEYDGPEDLTSVTVSSEAADGIVTHWTTVRPVAGGPGRDRLTR